jgi:hypothetical protein
MAQREGSISARADCTLKCAERLKYAERLERVERCCPVGKARA